MIQFRLLSGKRAGEAAVAREFPWTIGRESEASWRLDEPGVWEHHAVLSLQMPEGILLTARADATALVNGKRVQTAVLRGGDVIELGSAKLLFGLSDAAQKGLRVREAMPWLGLAALVISEWFLIGHALP